MTLDELLLQKLGDWQPTSDNPAMTVTGQDWTVTVTAERNDQVGCLVRELGFQALAVEGKTRPTLKAWADRIAERATGLLEGLRVLEIDETRGEALLRSDEPAQRGAVLYYYELLLKASGHATLRRYRGSKQTYARREQVPFALTHEAIAKLATDVTANG